MIIRKDTIDVWRKIVNAVESKGLRNCAVHISNKFEGTNLKASYDPSERRIYVDGNLDKEELLTVLAHEACHVLERDEGPAVITTKEMAELFEIIKNNDLEKTNAGSEASRLMMYVCFIAKEWTDSISVDNYIDEIEDCLDNLEDIKLSGEVKNKYFWNWFARNMDKLDEAINYYQCGGHTDIWLHWRSELERALQIKIDVAA